MVLRFISVRLVSFALEGCDSSDGSARSPPGRTDARDGGDGTSRRCLEGRAGRSVGPPPYDAPVANKRNRSRKGNAPAGPKLAYELFSELNATFYEDDPSEYLLVKIEAVTLILAPAEALTPAYESERVVGASRHVGTRVPSKEARDRYVRTECVLVLHHACETLLRLFFAHSENQDCPWLGMAASVSFAEFKAKVTAASRSGFGRDAVALVFLGGTDPDDSALDVEAEEFDDTVSAWQLLLETATLTVLSESFLYNAAKHGLTIVHTDESTQMAFRPPGGDPVQLVAGSQFAYLHRPQTPGAKGGTEWWVSLTHTLPDQDIECACGVDRQVRLGFVEQFLVRVRDARVVPERAEGIEHRRYRPEHSGDVVGARAAGSQSRVTLSEQLERTVHRRFAIRFDTRGLAEGEHVAVQRGVDPVHGARRPVGADQLVGVGQRAQHHITGVFGGVQANRGRGF